MKKIVAISGWRGSGKDLTAEFLIRHKKFTRLAFADALKDQAATAYGIDRKSFDNRDLKEAPIMSLPARAEDSWSETVMGMLYGHLRTEDLKRPTEYTIQNSVVYGVFDKVFEPLYHTPRSIAVLEGSSKRTIDSSYWVKRAVASTKEDGLYVISDLRYKSELRQLIEAAGQGNIVSLRIERFETTEDTDSSERDLDDYNFDFFINNRESEGISKNQVFEQVVEALIDANVLKKDPLI